MLGVWAIPKKKSLMRLVEIHKPNIVMTQETMGDEIKISRELSKKNLRIGTFIHRSYMQVKGFDY
jgi:hypothetical protein